MIRTIVATTAMAALAFSSGCKSKKTDAGQGSAALGPPTATPAIADGAVATAAGGEVKDLPVVVECPKSLGGTEKVARTIKKECGPIAITETLDIEGSLTLQPGVVLKFAPDAELRIGYNGPAKLIVNGGDAADQRVLFTSAGDRAPGVWHGVTLYDGADRSQITGLDVEYAGQDGDAAVKVVDATDVTFTKSSIKHAKDRGLAATGKTTFAAFTGNTFDDLGKIALFVEPQLVGTLGTANTFAKDAFVQIEAGTLGTDATWKNIGAPYRIAGAVRVDQGSTPATLTITDATLVFTSDAELQIGYNQHAKLVVTGPAMFSGLDAKPGSWKGVHVYDDGEAAIDNAVFASGGDEKEGALMAHGKAKVTLGAVTFKDNKIGLWIDRAAALSAPKPLTFTGNDQAVHLFPTSLGALSAANVYADGQLIQIEGGPVEADTTWVPQAKAVTQIIGDVTIDGHTLTVAAGSTYQWKGGTGLTVGYNSTGTLKIVGTAAAPVAFTGIPKGDPWNGITLHDEARSIDIAHLDLADVGGDAGVIVKAKATGALDHVTCARCAATVAPACKAQLELKAVTAGPGTKLATKPATGC